MFKQYDGGDGQEWQQRGRLFVTRKVKIIALTAFTLAILFCLTAVPRESLPRLEKPTSINYSSPYNEEKLHVVIPASNQDVNLCKLVLGCSLLGYPNPTLVAWNSTYNKGGILGGGSHLAKVSKVVEYLKDLDPSQDDELVLMLDAYDIHLQLPKATLISRYYQLRNEAQSRLTNFTGDIAVRNTGLQQTVIFGAGKRCAPNMPHTVSCYAIPSSPMPMIYGANTDTVIGHNHHYSVRQRYLNSGYVLGPAKAMRRIFEEAWALIEAHPDQDPLDDGSHASDFMYHGSDQSIFAAMYGRQEYAREKIRLQYAPPGTKPRTSSVFFTPIDNVLNPSFHHEEFDVDVTDGKNPYEYGIFLDFASDLGHQTINSELDATWITYNARNDEKAMKEQIGSRMENFDCPANVPDRLPRDVASVHLPTDGKTTGMVQSPWLSRPLYTHLCMSRIPVLRHMNGDKGHREAHWERVWYVPHAREMLKALHTSLVGNAMLKPKTEFKQHMTSPALEVAGAAWTQDGMLRWEDMCPIEYDKEVFRDVVDEEKKGE